jgi:2-polyprenyl-6-methoxyphenol hydroxylase-like FAD-dependent oxidoreductase
MSKAVLICGAGPVGLTMAAELARYQVPVRLVDLAAQRTDKSKALVMWPRTLELMERSGSAQEFIHAGLPALSASIFSGRERLAKLPLNEVDSAYKFALMIPQSETERVLEGLVGRMGARVERSTELKTFSANADGATATLRMPDGREDTAEYSWLIGCDGAHSTVRHRLGMDFEGEAILSDWALADVRLEGLPDAPPEVQVYWHADGILAMFPIKGDRYRLIVDLGPQGSHAGDPTLEEMQKLLDERGPGGLRAHDPFWLAAFHINERKVRDYREGRVFLAGDAAHIHSPAGGQGMNTGMQDAVNLAWKLALVYHDTCAPEPLLGSYSAERSAVGEQVVKGAGYATQLAMLRGGAVQAIRGHVVHFLMGFAPVQEKLAAAITEISIGYPDSPLNAGASLGPRGGQEGKRAPIRDGEAAIGAGAQPKFAIFADDSAEPGKVAARFPQLVEQQIRAAVREGEVWLVRPDGYVAFAGRNGQMPEVEGYLARLTGNATAVAS